MGIHNSVYRLFYDYRTHEDQSSLFGTIIITTFSWSLLLALLLFFFNDAIAKSFDSFNFSPYFLLAIFVSLINNLGEAPKSHLILKQKALHFSIVGLIQFLATTIFVIWFLLVEKEGAVGMLKGQVLGGVFMLPYFIFYSVKNFSFKFLVS